MANIVKFVKRASKKNVRLFYYMAFLYDSAKPRFIKRIERKRVLRAYDRLSPQTKTYVDERVTLYNHISGSDHFEANNPEECIYHIRDLKLHCRFNGERSGSTYCIDSMRYMRCFDRSLPVCFKFGDVTTVPAQPTFVKSRPIAGDNAHSVLLPLNKIRHFNFIVDNSSFESKLDMLIGVSFAYQPHRVRFMDLYFDHPMCRLGSVYYRPESDERSRWNVEHISIDEHLRYKFILCIEGNDVATNLKWVMSSNSLAVMPKPKYETWFMESRLVGGVHYVEIRDDYSDLEEKLQYYIAHPDEAQLIIENAHQYVAQFRDSKIERIIAMRVIEKYFSILTK